ncbi:hypothetical protein IPM19_03640 [bacterium]|nr:MAG: hypothetical protein IPM19_03640 [bacterium]
MKKSQKKAVAVGAGLAAVAAAAAGVYFLTGKNAKNRKKLAKWAGDMQNDVVRELNKAGKHTKASYHKVVDTVAKNYKGIKNVSTAELAEAAAELKGHWESISKEVGNAAKVVKKALPAKKAVKAVKATVKKAAKKATKKTTKKAK